MVEELLRSYFLLLFSDKLSIMKKIAIARDAKEFLARKLESMGPDFKGTVSGEKIQLIIEVASLYEHGIAHKEAVDKLLASPKWTPYLDEVNSIRSEECSETELEHFEEQLVLEKQYLDTQDTLRMMRAVMERVDQRGYSSIKEMQNDVEEVSGKLYMDVVRAKALADEFDDSSVIDYSNPDTLMEKMYSFYDGTNYVSSGYSNIDELLGGGFEKTRLYIFAGRPGSGKSTFLLNFMCEMSEIIKNNPDYSDKYILYVTLENFAMETNQRILCRTMDLDSKECYRLLKTRDPGFDKAAKAKFKELRDGGVVIFYQQSKTFGTNDLIRKIEQFNTSLGKKPLCVLVDYLDIMKLPTYHTELRHQLGDITVGLKNIASQYKIPVITASQLNKASYDSKPGLSSIKESSEKIDGADAIALIYRTDSADNPQEALDTKGYNVEITFEKSRASGRGSLKFAMDLSKFVIREVSREEIKEHEAGNIQGRNMNAPAPETGFTSPGAVVFSQGIEEDVPWDDGLNI